MGGVSALTGGMVMSPWTQVAASAASFSGGRPYLAAMHVHGSSSEQNASWESYGPRGQGLVDVIFMTDHDYRALAERYWTSLQGVPLRTSFTGSLLQKAATHGEGALRLLAESSSTSAATAMIAIDDVTTRIIWDRLRTSIAGHSLRHTFGASRLTSGATYEVRVTLSSHPAVGARPAGQYQLWYRFGSGLTQGRHLESGGLRGVVTHPLPPAGTTVTLALEEDVFRLWPDMIAEDNGFYMLSFVAHSPRNGAVGDIRVSGVQFIRTKHDAASIVADQSLMADTYGPRYGLKMYPSAEVGRGVRHLNVYTSPQYIPDQALNVPESRDEFYAQVVDGTHSRRGLVSWNHPFGANTGGLLSESAQATKRRSVFADLKHYDLYGSDILEVGYANRGQVDITTHLALWDTFSRHARFLTGNGVNDDHSAVNWRTLNNGFATGIWASSAAHPDLVAALAAGRAFAAHAGRWPGAQLDMMVDGVVPMGKVSVTSRSSRSVAIFSAGMPTGSVLELVKGPVDYSGNDPGAVVATRISASSFAGGATVSRSVDTSHSCYVRTQVRDSRGVIIGIGNPVWLLREPPSSGIPAGRLA
jgi:hypothetical protein